MGKMKAIAVMVVVVVVVMAVTMALPAGQKGHKGHHASNPSVARAIELEHSNQMTGSKSTHHLEEVYATDLYDQLTAAHTKVFIPYDAFNRAKKAKVATQDNVDAKAKAAEEAAAALVATQAIVDAKAKASKEAATALAAAKKENEAADAVVTTTKVYGKIGNIPSVNCQAFCEKVLEVDSFLAKRDLGHYLDKTEHSWADSIVNTFTAGVDFVAREDDEDLKTLETQFKSLKTGERTNAVYDTVCQCM